METSITDVRRFRPLTVLESTYVRRGEKRDAQLQTDDFSLSSVFSGGQIRLADIAGSKSQMYILI